MEKNFLKLLSLNQELKKNEHFLSQDQRKQLAKYQSQILDHIRWERKNNVVKTENGVKDFVAIAYRGDKSHMQTFAKTMNQLYKVKIDPNAY